MDLDRTILSWFSGSARGASYVACSFGALVLAGWALDIEVLKRVAPGFVAMNPLTAVSFIIAGLGLWFRSFDARNLQSSFAVKIARWNLAPMCAVLVGLIGLSNLLGLFLSWNSGIDQFLFHDKLGGSSDELPNRMAPNTAFNLILLSLSLWYVAREKKGFTQMLAIFLGLISWLAIVGYVYGDTSPYGIQSFIPMALHTAVLYLVLVIGILSLQPDCGCMGIVTHPGLGGQIARRILPAIVLIPFVFGWLRLLGERRGLYGPETGVSLMVMLSSVFCVVIILWTARSLNRLDGERTKAEAERRSLNEQLINRAKELEDANHELESFSYSVSHDLRAPVRHIAGFANLLAKDKASLTPQNQRYLNIISDSTLQMGQLIDDLLVFSRMGRSEMHHAHVDMNELLEKTIHDLQSEIQDRNIEWKKSVLPRVHCDLAMLRQVFVNLLANAVKYSRPREKAVIEIEHRESATEYVICVRDNGVGFDMKYAAKLFGVFQRLHHADQFEGTGIGLANVRRIIDRHDGRTWAEGIVDQGATFYFSLPKSEKNP